jgi:hypothetical protein
MREAAERLCFVAKFLDEMGMRIPEAMLTQIRKIHGRIFIIGTVFKTFPALITEVSVFSGVRVIQFGQVTYRRVPGRGLVGVVDPESSLFLGASFINWEIKDTTR